MDRSAPKIVGILLLLASSQAWGQESPIHATVGTGGATALSGPDKVHYATSHLEPETKVQIFRLDPGRWCAIRPPADSFSLVRAAAVEIVDADRGIGEVTTDEERCWIGTFLGPVEEPLWQIKLKSGERVRVLGSIPSAQDPDQPEWYQIAPPSGEFRWMHWADLDEISRQRVLSHFEPTAKEIASSDSNPDLTKPEPVAVSAESRTVNSPQIKSDDVALASYNQRDDEKATRIDGQWRQARRRRPFSDFSTTQSFPANSPSSFVAPDPTRRVEIAQTPAQSLDTAVGGPTQWPPALQELDLRLSVEILKEPAQWQLNSLAAETLKYKTSATQPSDIATADYILNKIRQFQQLQSGSTRAVGPAPAPSIQGTPVAPIQGIVAVVGQESIPLQRSAPGQFDPPDAAYAQSFDAHGWLNELVRDEGMGQTTYVLQDETGKITHLISATPGLNLHRYLKTNIGIVGQKGFHQGMKLDHVTAERIVSLDTLRR